MNRSLIVPDFVRIGPSRIAGLGAFATKPIRKNQVLGDYTGDVVDDDAEGDYVLAVQGYNDRGRKVEVAIDAWNPHTSSWARYLNSVRGGAAPNCKFFINGDKISVRALRDIAVGEELLVDYGEDYWDDWDSQETESE